MKSDLKQSCYFSRAVMMEAESGSRNPCLGKRESRGRIGQESSQIKSSINEVQLGLNPRGGCVFGIFLGIVPIKNSDGFSREVTSGSAVGMSG